MESKETMMSTEETTPQTVNFIEAIINTDNEENTYGKRVHTRFPPEPNGYLHIGHAKSICLNFGLGKSYHGLTNLRFDDTNPVKEDVEYVESIEEDVKWLGFEWYGDVHYASDYFGKLYEYAQVLIKKGKAYVDDQTPEEIRATRGDFTTPGTNSPYRDRSVEENLRLFEEMKAGKYKDGEKVLRAKIDMADPNIVMRDPVLYRILHAEHHRTGSEWNIYPMYDYAHPVSDAIERITHSVCTLEFEVHRPLYNWVLEDWEDTEKPKQIEFARLNVTNMVMSKRKLRQLVELNLVSGWDDPRMPTISGLRRRGYTPESIRDFCERIGVAKADSMVEVGLLEFCIREDLKLKAPRYMAVLDPVKVVITNYPEGQTETLVIENNTENEAMGTREVTFGREVYIERGDFMEEPVKKFFRLAPGKEVRLKGAYIIECQSVVKDDNGNITEIHCTYDPTTKSGTGCQKKVKGILHWVEASTAVDMEVRLYDYLLSAEDDESADKDFLQQLNPNSLEVKSAKGEAAFRNTQVGDHYHFLRTGYFVTDKDSTPDHIVMNRTVGMRDTWAKMQKKQG
ncbi:glutamine--tRNA ligase/YqeY domain fusion protein [Veillonella sp. DNF00869]|uniref:glutamine--tRNA ligase/YqeY domain fusion protein n=1 Tax=Veillonella sp. DNF00869 TaxID=1384081 RepID=UPI000796CE10|nr:glutamine--tRNA ligase/YqeY domain fusion protein [Veillonella sp. DNF00869]KXB88716.1 glutamine--tRNA ligase [Veillonella sp. DNF00869]